MKSETGFGLVGFLALLPLLMAVFAVISGSAMLFKADAHLKHECRTSVLNSQREAAEKLRDLLALNARATALRLERRAAEDEVRLAAGTGGFALAAAQAHLALVKARQLALAAEQRALILKAKAVSVAAPMKARAAVIKELAHEARDNGVRSPGTTSRSRPGVFEVVASPPGDLTPDYKPSPRFSSLQTVDVNVDIQLGPLLPEWLRRLLPTDGLTVTSHCQATIERQEDLWIETLNAVR